MTDRRQKPIPVTNQERELLNVHKEKFEEQAGNKVDWGEFLTTVTLLGLLAAGIYALAKATNQTPGTMSIQCSQCKQTFLMSRPSNSSNTFYVKCLHCNTDLVVKP